MVLDSFALSWDDPRTQRLREVLTEAYPSGAKAQDLVCRVTGFPQHEVNWRDDNGALAIWKKILDCAARAKVLRSLLNLVLDDPTVFGHQDRIRAIIVDLDADADSADEAERNTQPQRPTLHAVHASEQRDVRRIDGGGHSEQIQAGASSSVQLNIEPKVSLAIRSLREILARVIYEHRDVRIIAQDLDLLDSNIHFTDSAHVFWNELLNAADRHRIMERLFAEVDRCVGETPEWSDAKACYRAARTVEDSRKRTGTTTPSSARTWSAASPQVSESASQARDEDQTDWISVITRRCRKALDGVVPAVVGQPDLATQSIDDAVAALRATDVVVHALSVMAAMHAADAAHYARLSQTAERLRASRDAAFVTLRKLRRAQREKAIADLCVTLARQAIAIYTELEGASAFMM